MTGPGRPPGRSLPGVLIDANLVVLLLVGLVNPARIPQFKRTSQYTPEDFAQLVRLLSGVPRIFTVSHVLAEVSNLATLAGREYAEARDQLRSFIEDASETLVISKVASAQPAFDELGLTDAAIIVAARETGCEVLTDDLDLYLTLADESIPVTKFSHLRNHLWETP